MYTKIVLKSYLVAPGVALRSVEVSVCRLRRHVHRRRNESPPRDAGKMIAAAAEDDVVHPSSSRSLDSFFSGGYESRDSVNGRYNNTISMELAEDPSSRSVMVTIPNTAIEGASSSKFSMDEDDLQAGVAEGPLLAPGSPWWCTRVACAANVLLLVLLFTALLVVFRRARMSEDDLEALEEKLEEQGDSIEKTTDKILQGHIIDLPCRPGFKYFRGRCRRLF